MSAYTELQLLKSEEMVLVKITSKFSDQLNRLKVEELALLSEIREAETRSNNMQSNIKHEMENTQGKVSKDEEQPILNLNVKQQQNQEEEEEDEGDMNQDALTAFMT